MEALNAAALTPLSVLSDRKTTRKQPPVSACKGSSFSTFTNKKPTLLQSCLSKSLHSGLFLAASLVTGDGASALTYEEALGQPLSLPDTGDFDVNGFVESVTGFATENPAIVAGGVAILALPLVLSQVFKKPKAWGVESAKNAYAKLGADGNAQLLDIRALVEVRQVGSPDVGGLRKKAVSIAYKGDDKSGFLKKLALKFKEPENTTLFILDKFDGNSELVAELVTVNGFKAAYAVKDGAEGPRGWKSSGLPWLAPKKTLSLDNLKDAISEAIGDSSDGVAVTLGIAAAAAGLSVFAFSEIESILQVLGSAALVQFASKKLLFAELHSGISKLWLLLTMEADHCMPPLHHKPNTLHFVSVSALPPWLAQLADAADVGTEGPVELPFTSTPSIFATTDDPSPIQVASSILLTGAISVFLFRALRRRAQRVKQSQFRSSGVKSIKEEALDSLKALGSASVDAKGPPSPVQALLGGISAGVITLILYKFATTVDAGLNRQSISDNYSVRQITITVRTIVSGLTYLATFVFGLNSLGLLLYSGQLAIKSITGEDSTEKKTESKSTEQSNSSKLSIENSTDNTELSDRKEEQSSNDAQ